MEKTHLKEIVEQCLKIDPEQVVAYSPSTDSNDSDTSVTTPTPTTPKEEPAPSTPQANTTFEVDFPDTVSDSKNVGTDVDDFADFLNDDAFGNTPFDDSFDFDRQDSPLPSRINAEFSPPSSPKQKQSRSPQPTVQIPSPIKIEKFSPSSIPRTPPSESPLHVPHKESKRKDQVPLVKQEYDYSDLLSPDMDFEDKENDGSTLTLEPIIYDHTVHNYDFSLPEAMATVVPREKFIVSLDLSENNLTTVDQIQFLTLKYLNLSCNEIKVASFRQLRHLRYLSLKNNLVESLLELELVFCTELEQLDVSHNHIQDCTGIPASVRILNLSNNDISTQDAIRGLCMVKSLQVLDVTENSLMSTQLDQLRIFLVNLVPHLQLFNNKRKCL
jgi:Leucine-rich repeat (LRR) protein